MANALNHFGRLDGRIHDGTVGKCLICNVSMKPGVPQRPPEHPLARAEDSILAGQPLVAIARALVYIAELLEVRK